MKTGKRYAEAAKLVDRATLYDTAEAISLVKKTAGAKFDETIEAHKSEEHTSELQSHLT